MELQDQITRENYEAPITEMELNAGTPCGLLEANAGDRYLVTNSSVGKIAVVLRHRTAPAFTWIALTADLIATGVWLGDGEIEFTHVAPDENEALGTLSVVEDGWIHLRCQQACLGATWHMIAGTSESAENEFYGGWRILKWGKTFFEWTPPCRSFPLVLPFTMLRSVDGM